MIQNTKRQFTKICEAAGLEVNGNASHDPQIIRPQEFYRAFARDPFLAMGEGFCSRYYDVDDLITMASRFAKAEMTGSLSKLLTPRQKGRLLIYHSIRRWINLNNTRLWSNMKKRGQSKIADNHYDLDNDLMEATLGPSMKYTSAYWQPQYGEFDLDKGQELDLRIAGERVGLKEGMTVLDIGFGYGHNTKYFVEKFGVHVTGITISKEQKKYAEQVCANISDRVSLLLCDWRDVHPGELGKFDRVCFFETMESIGGRKNYIPFFQFITASLKDDGAVFGQVINTKNAVHATNSWMDKYIFPNGVLVKVGWMMDAAEQAGLYSRLVDNSLGWANGKTCEAWWNNFRSEWPTLKNKIDSDLNISKGEKYKKHFANKFPYEISEETFFRIWKYYLLLSSGGHMAGYMNDGHFIWEKDPANAFRPDIQIPQTRAEVDRLLDK